MVLRAIDPNVNPKSLLNCIPVVDVPVVGGKVDQPVVQRQLLVVKVRKVLLSEAEKLGFKRIRNEPQNILNHVYRVTQVYSTNLLLTYVETGGPVLLLSTDHAGWQNIPNLCQQEVLPVA